LDVAAQWTHFDKRMIVWIDPHKEGKSVRKVSTDPFDLLTVSDVSSEEASSHLSSEVCITLHSPPHDIGPT